MHTFIYFTLLVYRGVRQKHFLQKTTKLRGWHHPCKLVRSCCRLSNQDHQLDGYQPIVAHSSVDGFPLTPGIAYK